MSDISIAASVGEHAKNRDIDVRHIQKALNHIIQHNILVPLAPLKEDGIAGRNTKLAIRQFQRVALGMAAPDGRIDAGGKTLGKLNEVIKVSGQLKNTAKVGSWSLTNDTDHILNKIFQQYNAVQYGLLAGNVAHKTQTLNVAPTNNNDLQTLSKGDFVRQVFEDAKKEEAKSRVPAAVTTAQAVQETFFGKRVPTDMYTKQYSYNLFGIKGIGSAGSVSSCTHEVVNGKSIPIVAKFQAYHNFSESISGRTHFLTKNKHYKSLFDSTDPIKWAEGLLKAGYATDPLYATKLINIMKSWKLI